MACEGTSPPLSPEGTGGELWRSLVAAQGRIGELQAHVSSLADTVAQQNQTIAGLKAENDRLRSALGQPNDPVPEEAGAAPQHRPLSPAAAGWDGE